jgi:F-type H+-transporting ATPase subunit b
MEVNRAKEELRSKVAVLALAGAEKILQANIDEKTNTALVNDLASQL